MSTLGSNAFTALRKLLPDAPLAIGEVMATHADGTSTVQYPGGAQARVRLGSASAFGNGERVYVRNGVIEGGAPVRSTTSISV